MVDAGSGSQVLRQLSEVMPFYDRSIDVVVTTHPDKDHVGGIPDVLNRFKVSSYIESSVVGESGTYEYIQELLVHEDATHIIVRSPLSFVLDGVHFEVLFPDREVETLEKNTASLVMRVSYNDHSILLTGDSPKSIERYLVEKYGNKLKSDILHVGHHGSKTSSDQQFIEVVAPMYGVVSAGEENRYGHPHQEVLETLFREDVTVLETKNGLLRIISDGGSIRILQ